MANNTIKVIPTRYKGYHFRSRLEARWAVVFDALEKDWVYEPEGVIAYEGWYLPDFLVIHNGKPFEVVEIKPDSFYNSNVDPRSEEVQAALSKLEDACRHFGAQFGRILVGMPGTHWVFDISVDLEKEGPLNWGYYRVDEPLWFIYAAGRSARFEHGWSGAS